jgi:hypothetical protein
MKKGVLISVIMVMIWTAFTACSKSGTPDPSPGPHIIDYTDNTVPVVDIYTPGDNQLFSTGDTIKITGRVTDNGLYQGFVRITNDANSAILREQLYEIHGFQSYNFSLNYKTSVLVASDYTITVQFEDHGLNVGGKTVKVKVNP